MEITLSEFIISLASKKDKPLIQKFIDTYWKKGHILSRDNKFFDYQHISSNGTVNFVVAKNSQTDKLIGILGFIPTNQFDTRNTKFKIWLALWKAIKIDSNKLVGSSMIRFIIDIYPNHIIESLGVNDNVLIIYKKLGFKVGQAQQFYLLNPEISKFKLVKNPVFSSCQSAKIPHVELSEMTSKAFNQIKKSFFSDPFKSKIYYINRYEKHPYFQYMFFGLYKNGNLMAIYILRLIEINNASCLRVIDYIGDMNSMILSKPYFEELLVEFNAEYIDFLVVGWENEIFRKAGFFEVFKTKTIIPNYFSPFIKENIKINYIHKGSSLDIPVIYKGDVDQDRPN